MKFSTELFDLTNKLFKDLLKVKMDWIIFFCVLSSFTLLSIIIAVIYITHDEYIERNRYETQYDEIELLEH
jgi:hypothetical protein